ncbi:hypothetical protein RVR_5169 [Actinacidiphila reveromycinica]|uniref:Uncharacterized protein n=1 Tax=Actinacidiphila reveromycinica TaxID=659352 RepID=A0A7U3VPL5_9ACTN|nr:hypothetical protein [Streptomyces sp. SN-593]BBA98825.1 hypothetical protein RVR_5169 [Streptomyces sp. SN-593]
MPVRRAQRFICGRRTLVPDALVRTVLSLAADDAYAYTREDMFATLVCTIEVHKGPVHYGAALNLRGPEAGTLWALWRDGGGPSAVLEIPDCPAGREVDSPCSEFEGHSGGHSWELDDPPRIATAFPLRRQAWT